jgi:MFS family permease
MCIAVAGPRFQASLGISTEHWGWVLGAFILSYGIFEIPSGAWGDRWGHRGVLSRIVLWWSVFACLTGAATGLVSLLLVRFLFGAGEAGAYPNIAGVISRWFPVTERARMQGLVWGTGRVGAGITPWIVVPIMQAWVGGLPSG